MSKIEINPAETPAEEVASTEVVETVVETPPVEETPPVVEAPPVEETPPVVEAPPVEETPPVVETPPAVEVPTTLTEEEVAILVDVEKIPSNWAITSPEEGVIEAQNNVTGRIFTGTMEEFNSILRG